MIVHDRTRLIDRLVYAPPTWGGLPIPQSLLISASRDVVFAPEFAAIRREVVD
jgi:hypothetical protein